MALAFKRDGDPKVNQNVEWDILKNLDSAYTAILRVWESTCRKRHVGSGGDPE